MSPMKKRRMQCYPAARIAARCAFARSFNANSSGLPSVRGRAACFPEQSGGPFHVFSSALGAGRDSDRRIFFRA